LVSQEIPDDKEEKDLSILRKCFKKIVRALKIRKTSPALSCKCMEAIVKAHSISGPYRSNGALRDDAREFIRRYRDGDFRTISGMPDMTIREMNILGEAAGWK
jgi:hypothetical protein